MEENDCLLRSELGNMTDNCRGLCRTGAKSNSGPPDDTNDRDYVLVSTRLECDGQVLVLSDDIKDPQGCFILASEDQRCGKIFETRPDNDQDTCRCLPSYLNCQINSDQYTNLYYMPENEDTNCYKMGINYGTGCESTIHGCDNQPRLNGHATDLEGARACQILCASDSRCNCFTYVSANEISDDVLSCFLRTDCSQEKSRSNHISGLSNCTDEGVNASPTVDATLSTTGDNSEVTIGIGVGCAVLFCCLFIILYGSYGRFLKLTDGSDDMQMQTLDSHKETEDLSKHLIPFKDLVSTWGKEDRIGMGAFGTVYKATWGGATVACKLLTEDDGDFNKILLDLHCPNLVHFYGYCDDPKPPDETFTLGLVMEYIEGYSLYELIQLYKESSEELSRRDRHKILMKASHGLKELHNPRVNIVHRDLAARNIMVSSDLKEVKIIDFGMSQKTTQGNEDISKKKSDMVPVRWSAPEVFDVDKDYSFKTDVWSFGCTILELLDFTVPYDNIKDVSFVIKILQTRKEIPRINPEWTAPIPDLVNRCFSFNDKERPTALEIYEVFKDLVQNSHLEGDDVSIEDAFDGSNYAQLNPRDTPGEYLMPDGLHQHATYDGWFSSMPFDSRSEGDDLSVEDVFEGSNYVQLSPQDVKREPRRESVIPDGLHPHAILNAKSSDHVVWE